MRTSRILAGLFAIGVFVGERGLALGHGDLPVTQRIFIRERTIYVPTLSWGVFVGDVDGGPWRWICDEAINEHRLRDVLLGGDGTLYATDLTGLSRSLDNGCTWDRLPALAGQKVFAILPDPAAPRRLWITTSPGPGAPSALLRSADQGDSFGQVYAHPDGVLSGLAATPDGAVVHASLVRLGAPQESWIYSVREGGARVTGNKIEPMPKGVTPASAVALAASPRDPDLVYVRMQGEATSVLLQVRADTGAATEVLRSLRPIRQVMIESDRVLVATEGGILAAEGAGPFLPQGGLAYAQCLAKDGDAIYACAWNFDPDQAAVARSRDGGRSFARLFQFQDTASIAACPASSSVGQICPAAWSLYAGELGIDTTPPPPPMDDVGAAGCATTGGAGGAWAALWLLASLAWFDRRSRTRSEP